LTGKSPYLKVLQGKGGKDRDVNLNPYICGRLKSFTNGMPSEAKVIGITPKTVNSLFTNWAKRVGVPQLHQHSLRHKFATDIINSGGIIRDVQHLMGHESLATTEVYLAVADEGLSKTVGLLDKSTPQESTTGSKEVSQSLEKVNASLSDIKKALESKP
jgi:site-specific recombinase XerD